MASLYAGTSGFAYPAWKPDFYPAKMPANQFLKHYATRLRAVEINYTFRRLPAAATLAAWVEATPPGFVFAVKANMRITHILRLKNAGQATEIFLKAIDPLRSARRLGPILFQLPPQMKRDDALLTSYLETLPTDLRYAFEFRHPSWLVEEVYAELRRRNVSLCVAESEKLEVPEVITADFVYYRLRKPDYTEADVTAMAARSKELLAAGRDLYVMFKHEDTPAGAINAELLLRLAGQGRSVNGATDGGCDVGSPRRVLCHYKGGDGVMIEVKQAVQIAREKAAEMLDQTSFNLEEIERESYKGREVWSITLSLPRNLKQVSPVAALSADPLQYKRFLIDVETGELLALKLREVASQ